MHAGLAHRDQFHTPRLLVLTPRCDPWPDNPLVVWPRTRAAGRPGVVVRHWAHLREPHPGDVHPEVRAGVP